MTRPLLAALFRRHTLALLLATITLHACIEPEVKQPVDRVLFMYMPWSTNLLEFFYQNINDMEQAITRRGLDRQRERVIVFLSISADKATLFEITWEDGTCRRNTLKDYDNPPLTTVEGLAGILNDLKYHAPAHRYSMTVSAHGLAWLPVDSGGKPRQAARQHYWQHQEAPLTRFFGGLEPQHQTDINTFAEALMRTRLKMEYILFDDCYMSSVEVAYTLRNATRYLIGSTSEMMAYGMPYAIVGKHLLGTPDYQGICNGFLDFYSGYDMPYGTLAVTDCRQIDRLAQLMRRINSRFTLDPTQLDSLQQLDGYTPPLFYDCGDYVSRLCKDTAWLAGFHKQLKLAIPYKVHTPHYYSMSTGIMPIRAYSGITISDPSTNPLAETRHETEWWQATHLPPAE